MSNKWGLVDFQFFKTGTFEEITELACLWCKVSKEKVIDIFKSGEGSGVTDANKVQATAEYNKQFNALWDDMQNKKVDQYEVAYRLTRLNRRWNEDEKRHFAGSSEVSGHLTTTCNKCGNPIGFDYKLQAKVKNLMPEQLTTETWRSLPLPAQEILAKLLRSPSGEAGAGGLGGTVEDLLERINPHRFDELRAFMPKVQQMLDNATNIPAEFKNDFNEFLKLYGEWVEKEDRTEFDKYLGALFAYAEYAIAHDYPLGETHAKEKSFMDKVADALIPSQGVAAFSNPEEGK